MSPAPGFAAAGAGAGFGFSSLSGSAFPPSRRGLCRLFRLGLEHEDQIALGDPIARP